jgi:hypothetical protein
MSLNPLTIIFHLKIITPNGLEIIFLGQLLNLILFFTIFRKFIILKKLPIFGG